MAITKSFGGAKIRRPGAYSKSVVDNSGGSPLDSNDTLFIVGEAKLGKPGSSDGVQEFSASQINALVAKYGSGPIVDCALAARRPASLSTIGGAGKFLVYKTNAATQATLSILNADSDAVMTFKDKFWGQPGNNVSVSIANGTNALTQKIITVAKTGELSETLPENAGTAQLALTYTGDATAVNASVYAGTKATQTLTVVDFTWAGGETITIDGTAITEGVDFNDGTSNNAVAISIANALNAKAGINTKIFAYANGAVVTIQALVAGTAANAYTVATTAGAGDLTVGGATFAGGAFTGVTKANKKLEVLLSGDQTDSSVNFSQALQNLTIKELVDIVNAKTGFTCTLSDTAKGTVNLAVDLDVVDSVDISTAVSFYQILKELVDIVNNNSDYIEAVIAALPQNALPANISGSALTGGAQGASANSDFSAGLTASLSKDYNIVVPAISQDASADITLGSTFSGDFVTDAASAYTIASVLAAQKSHLLLRAQIENRKEAQGMAGVRNATIANVYTQCTTTASELIQIFAQDVYILDVFGELRWKQPHALAAMAAGIRLGTEVGTPLTHKFINVNDVGHGIDMADDLSEDGDFDPNTDYADAIDNGMSFVEKVAGGWRFVVDNTTYGADQSFVFNRGSVVEAAQYIAKTMRETAELVFVGNKVSNGLASSIKSVLRAKLIELNDANITSGSIDAPKGFVEETFVVTITGNTAEVQVEVKPVQGLDFIFITFTLGDIRQSA